MKSPDRGRSIEAELRMLEQQIDALIKVCDRLREENRILRGQQIGLASERSRLVEKNELARSQVEAMIMRLKAMEKEV